MTVSTAFERKDIVYFVNTNDMVISGGEVESSTITVRETVTIDYCISVTKNGKKDFFIKKEKELFRTPLELIETLNMSI